MKKTFQLSPQQQRLWKLQAGEANYDLEGAVELSGALDSEALYAAVKRTVERYEILRTTFPTPPDEGLPRQSIRGEALFEWVEKSLDGATTPEITALLERGSAAPFDLEHGPLLRATLVKATDSVHLVLRLSALCGDASSLERFVEEVRLTYGAELGGRDPEGAAPWQFADLAQWQLELLESEEMKSGRDFWRRQVTDGWNERLPCASPRPVDPAFEPRRCDLALDRELAMDLGALAREHRTTVDGLLLTAWLVCLWRLTGKQVVVGRAYDGRSYEELREAFGPMTRYLPFGLRLDGDTEFVELWKQARELVRELAEWQDYFAWSEVIPAAADNGGDEGHEKAFHTFAFDHLAWPAPTSADGLTFRWRHLETRYERFELRLDSRQFDDGTLHLGLDYDPRVYAARDVELLAQQLEALLVHVVARPRTTLDRARTLSPAERHQVLVELNQTHRDQGPELLIHELFEEQAQHHGDRSALVFEETCLSFAELDRRANRLARHLRHLGVTAEVPVAFCLERSAEVIVTLLAIAKAGGAYLPLDPALPSERLSLMLEDSGAPVLVSQEALLWTLPRASTPARVVLDRDADQIERRAETAPPRITTPANTAYVLFTSGSTGRPKGVMVEHRQVFNYLRGVSQRLDLMPGSTYAVVSTFAADLGNTVIFPSLATGGCLHVISTGLLVDPDGLAGYFECRPIDVLKIVPSHLAALQAARRPERTLPLRRLVLGGEASRPEWVAQLSRLAPRCRIFNHYGPTETTVGVLTCSVEESPDATLGGNQWQSSVHSVSSLPLGRPLANTRVYVLDREPEPLPRWVAGELTVAGANLTRGYFRRPAITAERFLPEPFVSTPGQRMYRTGDLARCRGDGRFEFLGRIDDQVKIHGVRIELGEVRTALARHPEVRECAVLARDDGSDARLVAYLVTDGEMPAVAKLRGFLSRTLPETMMPAAFVPLARLPLNANGKLDRGRLPAPDLNQTQTQQAYVAPTTPVERQLAEIWGEVLGLDQVGKYDNFFHIGGDSILSIEVHTKMKRRGLELSVAEIFRHPTIERLARHVSEISGAPGEYGESAEGSAYSPWSLVSEADREKIPPGVGDAFPLSMMQQGMLFHTLLSADAATYHNVGSYRIRSRVGWDPAAFRRAVESLIARHPVLRTSIDYTSFSEPLQLVHATAEALVESEDWSGYEPAELETLWDTWIEAEAHRPLDWSRAPLLRTFLHRVSEDVCQVTISFHHAILDGWSRHSMLTELVGGYLRELGRDVAPPSALPDFSYGEFIQLERAAVGSEEHRRFWSRVLSESERLVLPRQPGAAGTAEAFQARILYHDLPSELCGQLHQLARLTGVPVKSVLLAVALKTLSVWSGQSDVMTGMVVNGRPEKDAGEQVFGVFLNTVPVRLVLEGGTWHDLVRQAFEAEAALLPYRRYPLAEMQRISGSGEAICETAFNFIHFHVYRHVIELPDLEVVDYKGFEESNLTCLLDFQQDPAGHDVQLAIEYHAAVLSRGQIERMVRWIARICQAMVEDFDGRYEQFSPLSAAERRQLTEWNDTALPWESETCLHELFAEQTELAPDRVALAFEAAQLTYGTLLERCRRLAHRLRVLGVGPEVRVGIFAERSFEMVEAILGVLTAGGAYVPLDPQLPAARLSFLLEETQPPVVLTLERLRRDLPATVAEVVSVDRAATGRELTSAGPMAWGVRPGSGVRADNPAYVIYTSGSTGRPKGVVNGHGGVVNRLRWGQQTYGLTAGDRVLQKTSYSFDVSVWEMFWPLVQGARLVLARPGGQRESDYLARLIAERAVTVSHFVASPLRAFLEQPAVDRQGASLRLVFTSGEAVPVDLVESFCERLGADFEDLYGPTEASIEVTRWSCRQQGPPGIVPIGRPIANLVVRVLDRWQQLSPPLVPGELHIGGLGVARGYLKRPALSAGSFVPDSCDAEPGKRLYKTGDLARFLADGNVEFLGRIDHQVKIRGFRVELGEIEALMVEQPGVRDCVVLEAFEEQALVAYWVSAGEESAGVAELRHALKAQLPSYMVPSHFVALDALPMTASGKVDRRALLANTSPVRTAGRPETGGEYVAPRDELEAEIAELWCQLLNVQRVGVHDDFFELGGHSLLATRVISRLQNSFGIAMPMGSFFETPTVAALAGMVVEKQLEATDQSTLSEMLGEIQDLSPEELQRLLAIEE